MRILIGLSIMVVLLLAVPWTASGQDAAPLTIKNMKISVWPEYDDPRVLVMYEGEFADGSRFPQAVKFTAPLGSELKQVCALTKPDNEHECQTFKALEEDSRLAVNYTLPIPTFFTEYFYPAVQGETARSFKYEFKAPNDIQSLQIEVQQPLRSSGWAMSPTALSVSSDAKGFKYNNYSMSNIAAGRIVSIDASYAKADSEPSVAPASAPGGAGDRTPLVVSVVLALAALGGIGWLFFSGKRRPARKPAYAASARVPRGARLEQAPAGGRRIAPSVQVRSEQVPAAARRVAPSAEPAARPVPRAFCSSCGSKLDDGGAFCPGCGTEAPVNG